MQQPAVWVGPGCLKPCAVRAKTTGASAAELCDETHSPQSWGDGGCKLWSQCSIHCKRTCTAQPGCYWQYGKCYVRHGL